MRKLVLNAGVTIVELIAVIAIISVLTGFLLAGVFKILTSADIAKAKATIEQLEVALEMYSRNWGTYPNDNISGGKFTGCATLINALESETTKAKERGGSYVKYPAKLKDTNGNLLDPWDQPYRYHWSTTSQNVTAIGQTSPASTNITYNIWSYGPNGADEEMSISNPSYPAPLPSDLQRRYSDDIVNW